MEQLPDPKKVKFIGQTEAALGVAIAITIDLSFLVYNDYHFTEEKIKVFLFASICFFAIGQFLGMFAAKQIIVRQMSSGLIGILTAWATLVLTTMAFCFVDFFVTGQTAMLRDAFQAVMVVFIFSFLPSGIHGFWFGARIYNRGKKLGNGN